MATQTSDNIKTQMRKGFIEYCILLVLDGGDAYSLDIIRRLQGAGFGVIEGTVYPLLTRLKNNGLLAYRWEESTQGPPRKYFSLTDDGRAMLHELESAYQEIETVINHLKQTEQ